MGSYYLTKPALEVSDLERGVGAGKARKGAETEAEEELDKIFANAPRFGSYGEVEMALATEIIKFHTLVWFWFVQPGEVKEEGGQVGSWYRTTGGRVLFNSIINPPQGGILSVGAGEQRPVVKDGALVVATVLTLTLTVDHRCINGTTGAALIKELKALIENPIALML